MGIVICDKHGRSGIVQMSKTLHYLFLNGKDTDIVKAIFNIKELDESFIHYFSFDEDISQFKSEMDLDYFESEFSKISGDPGSSINCFKDYLSKNKVIERHFKIK
ncbi:hypothetical protein [Aquimarina sp. MMG016]|uniref:hypothetical protein n=1 Tax=Aquimarina sp. MMG016 TaxID=2822690 RepID=UPI001B3A4950|nr:hypothetical protein [Aquimarina sp. MMG016]MBQ4819034.1 hypothetical protein [Aquimarina sp. MMG016]